LNTIPRFKLEVQQNIFLNNGAVITAISADYQGESGANQGWVSEEEIWAFTSEKLKS
jgi:hypothetical protein